jgi:hypothetical protein
VLKRDLRAPAVLAMLALAGCSASSGTPVATTAPTIATTAGAAGGPALRVRDVLSPAQLSGPNFQVADEVNNDGFLNYYTVHIRQPEAMLEVAGTELLLVRLDELDAVAKLQETKKRDTFTTAAKNAALGPFRFARDLVTAPGETLSSTASGIGSYAQNVGHALFGTAGAGEEGALKTAIGFASAKRALAQKMNVDPYSTNPLLQQELDEVAWTAFAGGMAINLGFGALPDRAGLAAKGTGMSNRLSQTLRDNAPAELADLNEGKLRAMGVGNAATQALMQNTSYTPTDRTRLVAALEQLDGVADREALVEWAATAPRSEVAFLMARHAEMLAGYDARVAPLARFVRRGGRALPLTRDGQLVAAFPVDYVTWSERLRTAVAAAGEGVPGKQFWITGRFDPTARAQLEAAGWTLYEQAGPQLAAP